MLCKIENAYLSAEINDFGAELSSLKSKRSGVEYLWQGNPSVWNGRSPILFPIIGQLLDGKFTYDGNDYYLPKHGFARECVFSLSQSEDSYAKFTLKSDDDSIRIFPFRFELSVSFKLDGNNIVVSHEVFNKDEKDMYFSIGAHPGFNCALGDYLEFDKREILSTERIDDNAIIIDEKFPLLENTSIMEITKDIFIHDALFLSGFHSSRIKLKSPRHNRELNFCFESAPFLGIWAKPGAPYVCIEPWYGINDSYKMVKDISEKRGIQKLAPQRAFSFKWTAEISEP